MLDLGPDCLVGNSQNQGENGGSNARGEYNISIHQTFGLNGTNYYTIFDLPISVTNDIPQEPSSQADSNNPKPGQTAAGLRARCLRIRCSLTPSRPIHNIHQRYKRIWEDRCRLVEQVREDPARMRKLAILRIGRLSLVSFCCLRLWMLWQTFDRSLFWSMVLGVRQGCSCSQVRFAFTDGGHRNWNLVG